MDIFLLSPSSLALDVGGCPEKSNCCNAIMLFRQCIHHRHRFHNRPLVLRLKNPHFPSLQVTSIEPNKGRKPNATHLIDSDILIH